MTFTVSSESVEWDAVSVEMVIDGASAFSNPVHFYMTTSRVDFELKRMSLDVPNATFKVVMHARIKAVYRGGKRIQQSDMREFYTLSDEEYKKTQIPDSRTVEPF